MSRIWIQKYSRAEFDVYKKGEYNMHNKRECAGTYYVKGYTRQDGTQVSGYQRTCGAAHNSYDESSEAQRRAEVLYPSMKEGKKDTIIPESGRDYEQNKNYNNTPFLNPKTVLQGGVTYNEYKKEKPETSSKMADKLKEVAGYALQLGTIAADKANEYYSNRADIKISDIGLKPLPNVSDSNNIITSKNHLSNQLTRMSEHTVNGFGEYSGNNDFGLGSNSSLNLSEETPIEDLFYPTMKVPERKTPEEVIKQGQEELKEIEKERWLNHAKNWGGFALELGSAAIPLATGPKIAAGLAKTLTPVFGRKIAMEAATGIIDGGLSGAIQGLGEGMINDADLAESILNGAAVGTSGGALMGLGAGKASQLYDINKLKKHVPFEEMTKIERELHKKLGKDYYKNYEEGKGLKIQNNDVKYNKEILYERIRHVESTTDYIKRARKSYTRRNGKIQAFEKRSNNLNGSGLVKYKYEPTENFQTAFSRRKYRTQVYNELKYDNEKAAKLFQSKLETAKKQIGFKAASVYVYPLEEYKNMRLFLSEDGKSGFAIKTDGDIVSVFSSNKKAGVSHIMMELAIQNGGYKLDCFDTYLPHIYSAHGFKEVNRIKWNEAYRPDGWDKSFYKLYNNGEPDVVFMEIPLNNK